MPASVPAPSGAPCWSDLYTSDPDRAVEFYGEIFGWTAQEPSSEHGGYVNFTKGGALIAGMVRNDGSSGQPDTWTTYLSVPDAKAATEAATAAGAQVFVEAIQVDDLGTMSVLADPAGATVGLWQPGTHLGYGRDSEAGAPCWHELHTRDYAAALDFYRTAFGWETRALSDTPDFRYSQLVSGEGEYAGVLDASGFLPAGAPGGWVVYLGVSDVDAALLRTVELGGSVVAPAEDSPFGRLAQIADPTGATVKICGVPAG